MASLATSHRNRVYLGIILSTLAALIVSWISAEADELRDGDLIFQSSRSEQSAAIQSATHSRYSHMGIIFFRQGEPYVLEAVRTVQYTPLKAWIDRGEGGHYVVKRLRGADRLLSEESLKALRHEADGFLGKPYDLTFEWTDSRIYCSELVWKIYQRSLGIRIGEPQKLREFNLAHPAVKAKIRERYGSRVPLDEPVISPAAMFQSTALTEVRSG